MTKAIFVFGLGFTGQRLTKEALADGYEIYGTIRSEEKLKELRETYSSSKVKLFTFPTEDNHDILNHLKKATYIVNSCPVNKETKKDPVLEVSEIHDFLLKSDQKKFAVYLSTTGVYGNHDGGEVDEDTKVEPTTERGKGRVAAELFWQSVARENHNLQATSFRLPGIYGPGRGTIARLRKGQARAIIKKDQYFSRIHVDDIVGSLLLAFKKFEQGFEFKATYNICDDKPSDNAQAVAYAAELLGVTSPTPRHFDDIKNEMSPMARSFYTQSRRVKNDRLKSELGYVLKYPTYKEGFKAQVEEENTIDNSSTASLFQFCAIL
eukprot:maker-scaffold_3-snap-gene-13.44-mRNA-1 protein AED:0.03 eAED:0.03 QI:109/1/1/1/1/1/4/37/321